MKRSGRIHLDSDGFSLIELMIVVAILGLVGLIAIPSISNTFRFSVQSSGREIATLIKDAMNSAQVTGKVHRIAYDLKNQQYWVESTSENTLMKSDESREKEKEKHLSFFSESEDEKKKNGGFRQENTLTKNKKTLPIGVSFKDVVTEQSDKPITEGMAYTHIFPQGMTEKSLVHLMDTGKNEVSLTVSNLLGRCAVEGRYIEAKEYFKQ
ncbi:MAG: prepilin-type N-terminal cleavage/methylation domain-containing protein [Proteobacteria bacterium]|nr:prepilin-type N-terminal cleavage/methylation domain-containing protein [Pseudomonadota bacterium]